MGREVGLIKNKSIRLPFSERARERTLKSDWGDCHTGKVRKGKEGAAV